MSQSLSATAAAILRFRSDENGVTSIEYALIGVFIAVAIVASVTTLGTSLTSAFQKASTIF